MPHEYFRKTHERFKKGLKTPINFFKVDKLDKYGNKPSTERHWAASAFFDQVNRATQSLAQSRFRKFGNDPEKWRAAIDQWYPHLEKYKVTLTNPEREGALGFPQIQKIKKKIEEGKTPTKDEFRTLRYAIGETVFWEKIGTTPSRLTTNQRIILANANQFMGRRPFDYKKQYNSMYHLVRAMGYLFDPKENEMREGVYAYMDQRAQALAKRRNWNVADHQTRMQQELAELEKLFQRINALRMQSFNRNVSYAEVKRKKEIAKEAARELETPETGKKPRAVQTPQDKLIGKILSNPNADPAQKAWALTQLKKRNKS